LRRLEDKRKRSLINTIATSSKQPAATDAAACGPLTMQQNESPMTQLGLLKMRQPKKQKQQQEATSSRQQQQQRQKLSYSLSKAAQAKNLLLPLPQPPAKESRLVHDTCNLI